MYDDALFVLKKDKKLKECHKLDPEVIQNLTKNA